MKIKKFRANNFSEALKLVKGELGADAVILSSKEFGGLRPSVEVLAAVDYDPEIRKHRPEKVKEWLDAAVRSRLQKDAGSQRPSPPASFGAHYENALQGIGPENVPAEEIQLKIRAIRDKIGTIVKSEPRNGLSQAGKDAYQFLRDQAIHDDLALGICKRAGEGGDIESAVAEGLRVKREVNSKVVMIVGPTGVGKTTTIAKLAAHEIRRGRKTAIISLDTYRIGAMEQMRIYARIMGIPLAPVSDAAELKKAYDTYSRDRDILFIDTTGRNPRDDQYISQLREIARMDIPLEIHLLVSANSDDGFIRDAMSRYDKVPIECIGITKADEAVRYGLIYNLAVRYSKPVSYVTTGQKVPDDIVFPSSRYLSQVILQKRSVHA